MAEKELDQNQEPWVLVPALPLMSYVTFVRSLSFSGLQFPERVELDSLIQQMLLHSWCVPGAAH